MTHDPDELEKCWLSLRGLLKDIFDELGGGEAYLRRERGEFSPTPEGPHLES